MGENANFNTGGTGAALFAEGLAQSAKPKNNQQVKRPLSPLSLGGGGHWDNFVSQIKE